MFTFTSSPTLLPLYTLSLSNKMDNASNVTTNCTHEGNVEETIVKGVMGGIGSVTCIVALVFVLVSRFYKDIVQRLILYKLITVLIYSLSQFMFDQFDESNVYRAFSGFIPITTGDVNVMFTFWLTIILFICIVKLKELKNLKKLEPVAILTSLLPFASFILVPFSHFILDDDCRLTWQIKFRKGERNKLEYVVLGYSMVGLVYFIMSLLVIIIFIIAVKRSQLSCKRQKDTEYESPLLTNNKWRAVSNQLLPIVAYPIINTGVVLIYFLLVLHYYIKDESHDGIFVYILGSSAGLTTGTTVIFHLCILKCKKMQRKRQNFLHNAEASANGKSNVFTSDTIASTNARTEYIYTRTSSYSSTI